MTICDLDTSVPDWIIEHPEVHSLFREIGIDDSCGGKSLSHVCRQRGLDAQHILTMLRQRIEKAGPDDH